MLVFRSLRPWRALFVGSALAVVVDAGCAPDITFVKPKEEVSHCVNGLPDPAAGETDTDCGGPDCDRCPLGQACSVPSDCAEGDCLTGFCIEPGCTNQVRDGAETGIDCGSDCMPCPDGDPCISPTDCTSKSCKEEHCAAAACDDKILNGDEPSRDCGGSVCDGCPVDSHCAVATDCISLACDEDSQKCVLSCIPGSDDCDGDPANECETNLFTSTRNCGKCGQQCDLPHSSVMCVGGTCQIDTCESPWDGCDTDQTNGCETNLSNDAKNCGACGMECPTLHSKVSCVGGKCVIDSCDKGYGDCDEDVSNGCEAGVNDVENCLACDVRCSAPEGAEPFCTDDDGCGYSDCEDGRGNCAGDPSGECANDLANDVDNCGRCGNACSVVHGTPRCENKKCVVDECDTGWDNCNSGDDDGGYSDGCEVNTDQSSDNCGGCGKSCGVDHGDGTCQGGNCGIVTCSTGYKNCDTTAADGGFANGCETHVTSDPDNCGDCDNACVSAHAVMGCVDSACVRTGCDDNYDDCTAADGCETDTSSNTQHCGTCAGVCSNAGATTVKCTGGACAAPVCDSTHLNCDGINLNGCEATLGTTTTCNACPQNGGACTAALPSCVQSGSAYHCQANITVGSTAAGNVSGAVLNSVAHNLQSGSNRLVLVAVVGRSDNSSASGVTQGRPDTVTYAGVAMTKLDELAGPTNDAANLYVYYLTDTGTNRLPPTATGNQAIVIDGSKHSPQPKILVANAVQFNGVSQSAPVVTGAKTAIGANQTAISGAATIATSGSVLYAIASAQYVDTYKTPLDTDLVSPLTMSQNVGGNVVVAYGGVSAARAPGPVTISWNWNYAPQMSAQYLVVVQPAQN